MKKKLPQTFYKYKGNNGYHKKGDPVSKGENKKWFRLWYGMKQRCYRERDIWKTYKEKNIQIDEEWHDVKNFIKWCQETYPKTGKWSIDRIDNTKNYSPSNCRWASPKEQARNRSSNVVYKGKTLSQWAEENGLKTTTINRRLHVMHWDIEDAVTIPARHKRSRKD